MSHKPFLEIKNISKFFGSIIALQNISMKVHSKEVMCLLGDNGAGKSTLIKILSGVYVPDVGEYIIAGNKVILRSPKEAQNCGIATVYQDLAMVPLMSIARNFFLGSEPMKGHGILQRFDIKKASQIAREEMAKMGIDIRDANQPVNTLSGGERQCLAIARAVYFGAKLLILDEPTSALGVKEATVVLRYIAQARARGLAVIFITHNPHHAYVIGNRFTILGRGQSYGTFAKEEISREKMIEMMAGGEELEDIEELCKNLQ